MFRPANSTHWDRFVGTAAIFSSTAVVLFVAATIESVGLSGGLTCVRWVRCGMIPFDL